MRLIDADKLMRFFTVDTANQTYRFGTVKKQIESAPTVQAIPLDKVKQAKNEICKINPVATTIGDRISVMKNCDDIKLEVVAILNKLIEESEEK